jgi:phosphomannomutase/phosphoglucomutase
MIFILASTGQKLSTLINALPERSMIKDKISTSSGTLVLESLKKVYSHESLDLTDGVKILRKDSWALVRASGTEPIIRIIIDSDSHKHGQIIYKELMDHIAKITKDK